MRKRMLLLLGAAYLLSTAPTLADVPQLLNLQSIMRDSVGDPVPDGAFLVKFIIYDDPVASGAGHEKWSSEFQTVNTKNGLFEYHLGSNTPLPDDLFAGSDSALFLGITVGVNPEGTPRIRLTSAGFSHHALRSDSSSAAGSLGGEPPSYYLEWDNLTAVPAGFDDGIDDQVGANAPLEIKASNVGVMSNGIDSTHVGPDAIGTSEIADGSIVDADISPDAKIDVTKISGTAVDLISEQTIVGEKRFGDSGVTINSTGFRVGDGLSPSPNRLMYAKRQYDTGAVFYGFYTDIDNATPASLYGHRVYVGSSSDAGGTRWGVYSTVANADTSSGSLYALRGSAGTVNKTAGIAHGVYGTASAGVGGVARGVYGNATGTGVTWAGVFAGDVSVQGTLFKGGGAFRIDHPLDPANKYLQHSFVESPDMKNVYDGNAQLDGAGRAVVELPDYFEALNQDFRYQLTSIGSSQPGLYIELEVTGNHFAIAGGKPNGRVSWQVTGIRKDRWAEANRIEVEVEKNTREAGKYLHYEAYGVGLSQAVDGEELQRALDETSGSSPRHEW